MTGRWPDHHPLTTEQSALAESHLIIAHQVASYRARRVFCLTPDEVLSAAYLGLCLAARAFDKRIGLFPPYAFRVCHQLISDEIRRFRLGPAWDTNVDSAEVLDLRPSHEVITEVADLVDWASRTAAIDPIDGPTIAQMLEGHSSLYVAKELGVTPQCILWRRQRAIRRLREKMTK